MVAIARRIRHPGPPMPSDLDWASQAWRNHPLTPDVAMILPALGSPLGVRDVLTSSLGTGTAITRSVQPGLGLADSYNGSSSYADFGNSDRYAIATGGITIAIWFVSLGWGQNKTICSRRFLTGPSDYINWAIQQENTSSAPRRMSIFHTKAPGSYVGIQTTNTLEYMGAMDGRAHLLICSWTFGSLTTNALITLDGQPMTYSTVTGTDGTHTTHASQRLGIGADYSTSWSLFAAASIGPAMIYRRQLALHEHQQLFDPQTRWSMMPVKRSRRWFIPSSPPGPSLVLHRRRPAILHPGSRSAIAC